MFQKGHKGEGRPKKIGPKSTGKKAATPAEKAHMGEVAALGCICCSEAGMFREAAIHHLRHGKDTLNVGISGRSDHFRVLPLCPMHHTDGPSGVAFHSAPRLWRWDEVDLLNRIWKRLIRERMIPEGTPVGTPYEPTRRVISSFSPSSRFSSPGGFGLGS